jgi:hypothetical protein
MRGDRLYKSMTAAGIAALIAVTAGCPGEREETWDDTTVAPGTDPAMPPATTPPATMPPATAPGTMPGDTMMMPGDTPMAPGAPGTTGTTPP